MSPKVLPQAMQDAIVAPSQQSVLGLSLGQPSSAVLAALPAWFEKTASDVDQRVSGQFPGSGAFENISMHAEFSLQQLAGVDFYMHTEDAPAALAGFEDIADLFDGLWGTGVRTKNKGKTRQYATWTTPGTVAGELKLEGGTYSVGDGFSYFYRVEFRWRLPEGASLKPSSRTISWLDVDALAAALASPSWPKAKCLDTLKGFFAYDAVEQAQKEAGPASKELVEILEAAKEANPDLRPLIKSILATYDWKDVAILGQTTERLEYLLWRAFQTSQMFWRDYPRTKGILSPLNAEDVKDVVRWLEHPQAERAGFAWDFVNAVQFDDAASKKVMFDALAKHKAAYPEGLISLHYGSNPEFDAKAFAVMSAPWTPEEFIVLLAKQGHQSSMIPPAAAHLAQVWKVPLPPMPRYDPNAEHNKLYVDRCVQFLAVIRAHDEALFQDALEALAENLASLYGGVLQAICEGLTPDSSKVVAGWAGLQLGAFVMTRSDPKGTGRGRVAFKRHKDAKAAAADLAKKAKGK